MIYLKSFTFPSADMEFDFIMTHFIHLGYYWSYEPNREI